MRHFIFALALIVPLLCYAGNDEETARHRLSLQGSISTEDSYDYSAGYHYFFCEYVGVGAHLGIWSFFPKDGIIGETSEERDSRENFFFRPSVMLVSPTLFALGNCTFYLECEPSLMISTRQNITQFYDGTNQYREYRTDCMSWRCDAAFGVKYRNISFLADCAISNIDIKREYDVTGDSYSKKPVSSFGIKIDVTF